MPDIAYLITETFEKDAIGQRIANRTEHMIYADVRSVTQTEWYQAARSGLKAMYMITCFAGDYDGQKLLKYKGEVYRIYRTYESMKDNMIELYIEPKAGVE